MAHSYKSTENNAALQPNWEWDVMELEAELTEKLTENEMAWGYKLTENEMEWSLKLTENEIVLSWAIWKWDGKLSKN